MIVFDSSALIAFLQGEDGGIEVGRRLSEGGVCSAANWAEVAQKVGFLGDDWLAARAVLLRRLQAVEPVTASDAEQAAALWRPGEGLSLGDRLCLALGRRLRAEIVTADRAWAGREGVTILR